MDIVVVHARSAGVHCCLTGKEKAAAAVLDRQSSEQIRQTSEQFEKESGPAQKGCIASQKRDEKIKGRV